MTINWTVDYCNEVQGITVHFTHVSKDGRPVSTSSFSTNIQPDFPWHKLLTPRARDVTWCHSLCRNFLAVANFSLTKNWTRLSIMMYHFCCVFFFTLPGTNYNHWHGNNCKKNPKKNNKNKALSFFQGNFGRIYLTNIFDLWQRFINFNTANHGALLLSTFFFSFW